MWSMWTDTQLADEFFMKPDCVYWRTRMSAGTTRCQPPTWAPCGSAAKCGETIVKLLPVATATLREPIA